MPDSSHTSRRTASSTDSAGSRKPASVLYQYGGQRFCRPSRILVPSELTTAMMTVGSVRGKLRLEMPVLVAQDGRSRGVAGVVTVAPGSAAMSVGGHDRFHPALVESVG